MLACVPAGQRLPGAWVKNLGNGWFIVENRPGILKNRELSDTAIQYFTANNRWKPDERLRRKMEEGTLQFPLQCQVWLKNPATFLSQQGQPVPATYPVAQQTVNSNADLLKLIENKEVISIAEKPLRKANPESAVQRFDAASNTINLVHSRFPQITGKGLTVSVKEDRFDTADIDLKKRWFLTGYSSAITNLHATEISTLLGGSGNTGTAGKGVATGVRFTSASFEELMPEPPSYFQSYNISVQNHSYGTAIENDYAADAASYDLLTWHNSSLVHVFSAGNEGDAAPPSGIYQGINGVNNLTGSFKMSKNSISVGATDSFNRVEILSSKGPAYDGRIKPELVAFGTDGTSGAAALTSGAALLLQQALRENEGKLPPSSLVKSILLGSADEIGQEGPDYASGFGRLNAYSALLMARNKQYFTGVVQSGSDLYFDLEVPPNTGSLKVTLCWTDTAATPGSAVALVNDLDLWVEDPSGAETWLPWVLSQYPHADSLQRPAQRGTDRLNNAEQVSISNPAAGLYRIRVSAFNLLSAQQPFSLAYRFTTADSLYSTYPAAGDGIPAGTSIPIRWQQSFAPGTELNIELNTGGTQWQPVAGGLAADAGYFYWTVPDTTVMAQLRFTANNQTFAGDPFFITGNPAPFPGYICNENALLVWHPLREVSGYHVYTLGDSLMEKAGTTTDTVFSIPAAALKNKWVTLSAMPSGSSSPETRFSSFNIFEQGIGCYFRAFIAEWNNGEASLRASLGTTYGIKSLTLQKYNGTAFATLQSIAPVSATEFLYTDRSLTPGANTYRVELLLQDGAKVYSELQTIIQPNGRGWWVFPNPVKRGNSLKIVNRLSDTADIYVDVYDITGRKAASRIIPLIDNTIPVSNLAAGTYFLVFTDGKKQLGTQKLVVLP